MSRSAESPSATLAADRDARDAGESTTELFYRVDGQGNTRAIFRPSGGLAAELEELLIESLLKDHPGTGVFRALIRRGSDKNEAVVDRLAGPEDSIARLLVRRTEEDVVEIARAMVDHPDGAGDTEEMEEVLASAATAQTADLEPGHWTWIFLVSG